MNAIETGLYSALSGDSALTTKLGGSFIYNQIAPQTQAFPYVVFQHTGGGHMNINPSDLQGHLYLVKAVDDDVKVAGQVDDLVKAVLHQGTLTVSGYTNVQTLRETQVRIAEVLSSGKVVYHAGAYYRILVDA